MPLHDWLCTCSIFRTGHLKALVALVTYSIFSKMIPLYTSKMGTLLKFNNFSLHFPSLIQAKYGRSGKWGRHTAFISNRGGSSNSNGTKGPSSSGLGGFDDGFNGSKPRASSELLFFSTGKSFASYPLDHQNLQRRPDPHDALKTMMKPAEVLFKKINT